MTTWNRQGIAGWRKPKPPPVAIRLPYAKPNRLQRNRWKAAAALFLATLIYVLAFQLIGRFMIVQFLLPVVILLLLIIWALPERGPPPRRLLTGLLFAFLIALLLWPDYLAIALPGMPWVTALRLTGFPLALVFLFSLSVSKSFRWNLNEIWSSSGQIYKMALLLAVIFFASSILSRDIGMSMNKLMVFSINLIVVMFVSSYVFSIPGNAQKFVYIVWFSLIVVAIIAFRETQLEHVVWANSIPSFLKIEDEAVIRLLDGSSRAATGLYRVQAKYTTPLSLAEFLAIATPFILHAALTARIVWLRPLAIITLPIIWWAVVRTDSRLGAAGFMLSFVIYAGLWAGLRWFRDRRSLFGPAITLAYPVLFSLFIAATFFVGRLRAMVWGTGAHQFSDAAREVQWGMALPKIFTRPWGHGLGQGAEALGYTNLAGILTIDSYFLSVLLEIGILGFLVYFGLILAASLRSGWYLLQTSTEEEELLAPVMIALLNFVIIKSVLSQQEGHPLVFALIGMAVALVYRVRKRLANRHSADLQVRKM